MDDEVVFLTVDNVIKLHQDVIAVYSPGEALHISSPMLLDSATMTPQQTFDGEYLYLNMNGFRINLTQDEATELTFGIVEHLLTREDVVEILDRAIEEIF